MSFTPGISGTNIILNLHQVSGTNIQQLPNNSPLHKRKPQKQRLYRIHKNKAKSKHNTVESMLSVTLLHLPSPLSPTSQPLLSPIEWNLNRKHPVPLVLATQRNPNIEVVMVLIEAEAMEGGAVDPDWTVRGD